MSPPLSFTPFRVMHRLTASEVYDLVRDYHAGIDTPALAERYAISKTAVKRILHQRDVQRRRQSMTATAVKRAAELRTTGATLDAIAAELGCSRSSVARALRAAPV